MKVCTVTTTKKITARLISPGGWHKAAVKMQGFDYQTAWRFGFKILLCANFQYNFSTSTPPRQLVGACGGQSPQTHNTHQASCVTCALLLLLHCS